MYTETNNTQIAGEDSGRLAPMLENAIRNIGIPPCPDVLNKINIELRKDDPDFNLLAQIINSDVGVAAGLIAIANSPFFGGRNPVRSVNQALMKLGLRVASQAVAGIVLKKLFPATPSLVRFWHCSASIARLSGWLAQQELGVKVSAEDAYIFGLFRDCGIAVLMGRLDHYQEVLKKANEEKELSFTAVEDAECSINHAAIGCMLAQSWWLPEEIYLSIRHHHDYHQLAQSEVCELRPVVCRLIAISLLAEHLFQHHTALSYSEEWLKGGETCLEILGLGEGNLAVLYQSSAEVVASDEL